MVIGIGALKYYAPAGRRSYTAEHIRTELDQGLGATDEQIGGEYAGTQISDRILRRKLPELPGQRACLTSSSSISSARLFS